MPSLTDSPCLLVIDDDPLFQAQIELSLGRQYRIDARVSAADGLREELLRADTVLLDLNMPGRDGLSFFSTLATLDCPPKLLIVSGHDETVLELAHQAALLHGLHRTRTLRKPLTKRELLTKLAELEGLPVDAVKLDPSAGLSFLASDVITASREGQLRLLYQPQICLTTGSVIGMEALVRWHHPYLGCIVPSRFIPSIENSEHAEEFTLAIAEQAIRDVMHLTEHGGFDGKISVNIPPMVLESASFTDRLIGLLAAQGFEPARFQCEVTERGIESGSPMISTSLARLRMRGIQLAIDDFGVGQSGLWKIKSQAFDEVKIDQSFIQDMTNCKNTRSIVESIVYLAQQIGMRVIAEGVENESTQALSISMGLTHAQGFHCARPMSISEVENWLSEWYVAVSSGTPQEA